MPERPGQGVEGIVTATAAAPQSLRKKARRNRNGGRTPKLHPGRSQSFSASSLQAPLPHPHPPGRLSTAREVHGDGVSAEAGRIIDLHEEEHAGSENLGLSATDV